MGENGFLNGLLKIMLGWARWLTDLMWSSLQSGPADGGFLNWFKDHWMGVALVMIVIGVTLDWLVWMIRWRPYWLWFRKKQIIYAEDGEIPLEERQAKVAQREAAPQSRQMYAAKASRKEEEDPFAEDEAQPVRKEVPETDVFAPKKRKPARMADPVSDDTAEYQRPQKKAAPDPVENEDGYHVMFGDQEKSRRHVMFERDEYEDPFADKEKR